MTTSLLYSPITVTDVDAALAFYRDGLGLPVANDVAANGGRWSPSVRRAARSSCSPDRLPAAPLRTARRWSSSW